MMKTKAMMMTMATTLMAGYFLMAAAPGPDGEDPVAGDQSGTRGIRPPSVQKMRPPMNMGNWIGKFICQSNTLDRLGVTNAAARAKIVKDLTAIDEQMQALTKKIRTASIAQAKIAPTVIENPGTDTKDFFAKIDEIGALRTEQAKLATQVLIVLRDQLSDEQRADVKEMMETEGRNRFRARQQFNEEMDKRQPRLDRREGGHPRGGDQTNMRGNKRGGAQQDDGKEDRGPGEGGLPPPPGEGGDK